VWSSWRRAVCYWAELEAIPKVMADIDVMPMEDPVEEESKQLHEIDLSRYPADYDRFSDEFRIFGRKPTSVMWTIQTSMNILSVLIVATALHYLKFMLVPLLMAYFVTFLQAPFLDLFEARPLICGTIVTEETKELPEKEQVKEERYLCDKTLSDMRIKLPRDKRGNGSCKGTIIDMILMGKMPHGLAVLATLAVSIGGLGMLFTIIGADVAAFFEKETCKTDQSAYLNAVTYSEEGCKELYDPNADTMGTQLITMGNDFIAALEDAGVNIQERNALDYGDENVKDIFGVPVQRKNASVYQILPSDQDDAPRYQSTNKKPTPSQLDAGLMDRRSESDLLATVTILNLWDYTAMPTIEGCRDTENGHPADEYCASSLKIFGGPDIGTPWSELMVTSARLATRSIRSWSSSCWRCSLSWSGRRAALCPVTTR